MGKFHKSQNYSEKPLGKRPFGRLAIDGHILLK
jgi:hypothetical protein